MSKLNQLMQQLPNSIDCGFITSNINRRYFTNFPSSAGILLVTRQKAYFFIDFRYFERASAQIADAEVILLEDAAKQLKPILQLHNCKTIGVETDSISLQKFFDFQSMLSGFELSNSSDLQQVIDQMRMIKTQDEIDNIKAAQNVTELAFEHILEYITEGKTEKEIEEELNRFVRDHADELAFDTIVVSGRNSSSPHGNPTNKRVEDGDFITMDFGARLNGYHSDMTRTVFVGSPTEEQVMLYKTVLFGQSMALDFIKADQQAKETDHLVRFYFNSQGYENCFGHGLGHGVGLEIHEKPALNPKSAVTLRPGMVVTIEPGLYLPGKFGVRIEDMVVITKDGCKNLTNADKQLICL